MIRRFLQKIYQQNQWYDSLDDKHSALRFMLFLIPQLLGLTLDLYWAVLFGGTPMFTYLAWAIMALWRFPYVMSSGKNTTSKTD